MFKKNLRELPVELVELENAQLQKAKSFQQIKVKLIGKLTKKFSNYVKLVIGCTELIIQ